MEPLAAGLELAGRFRLLRALGRGGSGEVWLAEEMPGARPVALKFPGPGSVAILEAAFGQAGRLVHPGIVTLREWVGSPRPFLVMQYVEGEDLGSMRGAGYRAILAALVPVAEALEYAHRQGVVHRDLKPANVLRDRAGRTFVADFGVGALSGGGTLPGMSPQQLDGAAPAVSDDVYGFGALAFELLAGQPPLHPNVTPDRIRTELPEPPASDLAGEPLPPALVRLLATLLAKDPRQRPPGMGAVRAALEEILAAASPQLIEPLQRARGAGGGATLRAGSAPARDGRVGLPAPLVWGGLAMLTLIAAAVALWLPTVVRERTPAPRAPVARDAVVPDATPPAAEVPQATLDEALSAWLRAGDELGKLGAPQWGGADWTEIVRLAAEGDAAYRARDAATALARYATAGTLARQLVARAPSVLAAALGEGEAALLAGDQARALASFETALAIAPGDARAARGLARARNLERLLALSAQASAAEAAGERAAALRAWREAAALDAHWAPARDGVARLLAAAASEDYQAQMARGFAAQAARDFSAARTAFEGALRVRPGDSPAATALAQVDADRDLDRLAALQAEARVFDRDERWNDAVARHEAALALDANLAEARTDLERARGRAELDRRLRAALGDADRFNDDAVLGKARALLAEARAVAAPGPVLAGQAAELERLLALAVTPVAVTIESDNLTEVTVYKVGRLGAFASRSLQLRPGAYTAVGSRPGYRDVRRNFRVAPGADAAPVVIRCEEPI